MSNNFGYADLVKDLHQASDEHDRGHGPLHALAANAIEHLTTLLISAHAPNGAALREALDSLLAFRHGDTKHFTQEHARVLYAALSQPVAGDTKSAPPLCVTPHNSGERDPSVMPDSSGADTHSSAETEQEDWRDDPSADERWNAGVDFVMKQICYALGVDPKDVRWDAATETVDGDVNAVIWNIFRAKMGEDWDPDATPSDRQATIEALEEALEYVESDLRERFSVSGQHLRDKLRALATEQKR